MPYNKTVKQLLIDWLTTYIFALAKILLAIYKPMIIGVTGSVGKTTTKEAIAHLLASTGKRVGKTGGNLNAELGIGLTILGYDHSPAIWEWPFALVRLHFNWLFAALHMRPLPAYLVLEMGIDRLGDMTRLTQSIKPDIGVITWIGEGHHLEFLVDAPTIAREKGQLLAALPADGLAIIPQKDPNKEILSQLASAPISYFESSGIQSTAEIAAIIGQRLGIDEQSIKQAQATFIQPKGRLNKFAGINDSQVLDDSYNMSLPAAKEALRLLAVSKAKRKVAILGDILEQGKFEEKFHQTLADLAHKQADLVIGVGRRMRKVKTDYWFASPEEAAREVAKLIKAGDLILVKGSQGMRMEKVSLALAADATEAQKLLPRMNARWRQIPFTNP